MLLSLKKKVHTISGSTFDKSVMIFSCPYLMSSHVQGKANDGDMGLPEHREVSTNSAKGNQLFLRVKAEITDVVLRGYM